MHTISEAAVEAGVELRAVMRFVPSPVAVVTSSGGGEARGMTISSLRSISLTPPLVSFTVAQGSQMNSVLSDASWFAAHIMERRQIALCQRFAQPGLRGHEQLEGVPHTCDVNGVPILSGAVAVLRCRMHAIFPAGDHLIVVGEVTEVERSRAGEPLVYFGRSYCGVGRAIGGGQARAS